MQQKKKQRQKKIKNKKKQNGFKCYADFQDWMVETRNKLLAGMTGAEKKVRECLMVNKVEYKQQYPIHARQVYFADFYLPEHNVVIEVDGGYHNEPEQKRKDIVRQRNIEKEGFMVMRIKNEECLFIEEIFKKIQGFIHKP